MTLDERIPFVIILTVALLAPLLADGLRRTMRVPVVVLEIALGILIGPHVLGWAQTNHVIDVFASIGMFFLFFIAGFELDLKAIRGQPSIKAVIGWFLSVALALAVGHMLQSSGVIISAIVVALAMTTTAIGTLLPMLRDAGEVDTPLGRNVLAAGAIGEFGPVVMMALLLEAGDIGRAGVLIALFVVLAGITAWIASKARTPLLVDLLQRLMHTSAQLPMRAAVLLMSLLVLLTFGLGLDAVLGAVTAGVVVSLAIHPGQRHELLKKFDGFGFGFFIPIFFIVSGMRFDLAALVANPAALLRVPLFLLLFLAVRGLPALLLYRSALPWRDRCALALLSSTQLPLIVAITTIGVATGRMHPENAAALVGAGMLSVFVYPLLAFTLRGQRMPAAGIERESY